MKPSLRYKEKHDFNPLNDTVIININEDKQLMRYDVDHIAVTIELTQEQIIDSYVKFIAKNLKLSNKAAQVLKYIISEKNKSIDKVRIDMEELKKLTKYNSLGPIYSGFNELIEKELIARTNYGDQYFINPNFIKTKMDEVGIFTVLVNKIYKDEVNEEQNNVEDDNSLPKGFNKNNKI